MKESLIVSREGSGHDQQSTSQNGAHQALVRRQEGVRLRPSRGRGRNRIRAPHVYGGARRTRVSRRGGPSKLRSSLQEDVRSVGEKRSHHRPAYKRDDYEQGRKTCLRRAAPRTRVKGPWTRPREGQGGRRALGPNQGHCQGQEGQGKGPLEVVSEVFLQK